MNTLMNGIKVISNPITCKLRKKPDPLRMRSCCYFSCIAGTEIIINARLQKNQLEK